MKRRGSISIFAAMSFMLIAAVLFTLLEGARIQEERRILQANTDSALESVFAGYDTLMWDNYHLLLCSAGATEDVITLQEFANEFQTVSERVLNPQKGMMTWGAGNYLRAKLMDVEVQKYTLVTDGKGIAYQNAVAAYMKHNLAKTAAQKLKKQYESQGDIKNVDVDGTVADAQNKIDTAQKSETEDNQNDLSDKVEDNPLKAIIKLKKMGVLAFVLPDGAQMSEQKIALKSTVSHRSLDEGNIPVAKEGGWYEKVLVQQYYAMIFSDYLSPNKNGALQYEREYLLGGKSSDLANLKSCVNKILAVREAANLLHLTTDAEKQNEATDLAMILAGATANPAIIEAVKAGILAAWAYAESILDLRTLMQGETIAFMKTAKQWTSDIYHLSQCLSKDFKAKTCKGGMSYTDYVNLLLYTKGSAKMACRAMDLQELLLRKQEGYEAFRMDHMLVSASLEAEYEYSQNFLTLVSMKNWKNKMFSYKCESSYSYIKAGV